MNWLTNMTKIASMLPVLVAKLFAVLADKTITVIELIVLIKNVSHSLQFNDVKLSKIGKKESVIVKELVNEIMVALEDRELTIQEIFDICEKLIKLLEVDSKVILNLKK